MTTRTGLQATPSQLVGRYPEADVIRVVLNNLNTHTLAALYHTFPAAKAHSLTLKLEFHQGCPSDERKELLHVLRLPAYVSRLSRHHPTPS